MASYSAWSMFLMFGSHEEKLLRSAQVAAHPIEKPLTIPTTPSWATVQDVLRSTFRTARRLARIVLASIPQLCDRHPTSTPLVPVTPFTRHVDCFRLARDPPRTTNHIDMGSISDLAILRSK
jgi:hypothetical protein